MYEFSKFSALVYCSCWQHAPVRTVIPLFIPEAKKSEDRRGGMSNSDPIVRQRILADMLYEAQLAFEDNRLMTPPGNNAYDGFRMILDIDPENVVAQQGIRDIVLRYVELADAATQLRQYDNAENFLNRAVRIDGNNKAVADARDRLERARNIQMDIFTLTAKR